MKVLGPGGLRLLHHRNHRFDPGGAEPVEQVEAEGDQDAPRRRGRIGEHIAATEPSPRRIARDRLIRSEVLHPQGPAAIDHPLRDRPRQLAPVEGLGALDPVALQRFGELLEAEQVALPEPVALRRVDRVSLARPGNDPHQGSSSWSVST